MPYPSKISMEAIVEAARSLIETNGVDGVWVNPLADKLEVKPPSLYRYVKNKAELLRAVNEQTFAGLFEALAPALESSGSAEECLVAAAHTYRAFARANPVTYGLVFSNTLPELRPDPAVHMVLPYQALVAQISGEANSLPALRGLLALMHGFVTLELAQQFQRGGDLETAYEKSIRAYLAGLKAKQPVR